MAAEYSWSTYCIASRSNLARRSSADSVETLTASSADSAGCTESSVGSAGSGRLPALLLVSRCEASYMAETAGSRVLIAFKSTVRLCGRGDPYSGGSVPNESMATGPAASIPSNTRLKGQLRSAVRWFVLWARLSRVQHP
ncbi:hypothetical protein ARTHRO9AX_180310 [Arthrobacter sp. 9AX]|nr:hypothetical protein ARTHRO9AX_180310 [Arthrobacter sp. 9AX]